MDRHFHIFLFLSLALAFGVNVQGREQDAVLSAKARQWQQQTPEGFVENKGQLNDQNGKPNAAVKYLLQMPGLNVQLRATGFSYDAWMAAEGRDNEAARRKFHRVDIELEGANPNAALIKGQTLTGTLNVLGGKGVFENIRSYRSVTYRDIYPGIDLEFVAKKGTDKPVEYNFIVHPGADASLIKMKYNSGSDISLENGMIEMDLAFGILREKIPASYTRQDGQSLAVQYKAENEPGNVYAFNVPDYDRNQTLVIDPTPSLVWATYYGGNTGSDAVQSIDIDADGNIYIGGGTGSAANIATAGTYQSAYGGATDLFVAKFTAAGVRLWGTYMGGSAGDISSSFNGRPRVRVDGSFVYLAGPCQSTGMATVGQISPGGGFDGLIGKFNTADGTRVWGTYYGGTGNDLINDLFVDADGSLYIAGFTASITGIATAGAMQTTFGGGTEDGFIARFDASGILTWGTYLGGGAADRVQAVITDATGMYVTGQTGSTTGITTAGAFQEIYAGGGTDIFLAKINSAGNAKTWCTYWGGDGSEVGLDLKKDQGGNLIVLGSTGSVGNATGGVSNGLASAGAMQTAPLGNREVVIGKFTAAGGRIWSTYYGGEGHDFASNFDLDENDNILLAGDGTSGNLGYPTFNGAVSTGLATNCTYQSTTAGSNDAFITKISADGSNRLWASYFGGDAVDRAIAIRYAGNGSFLVGGLTLSAAGIATSGSNQPTGGGITGSSDGWFGRFSEGLAPSDVMVTATTLNPMSQTTCIQAIPAIITGNAISLYNPPGFTSPVFYQWQVADAVTGPWTDIAGEVYKDLQPLPAQVTKYYRRLVLVNNGFCDKKTMDSSAVASVLLNSNVAPIADADGPQWYVCGSGANTVTLNGAAAGGSGIYSSYQWFAGSDLATPVASMAVYTPTVTATTTYTLKVTDNAGCQDVDQVTVVPVVANAGPDVNVCENSGGVLIGAAAGIPGGSITYQWTSVSGSPVSSLSCTNCAQPIANPTMTTIYQLQTTVLRKDGTTCTTTDEVTVTFVTLPAGGIGFAGADVTTCKNTPAVLGGTNDATATYTWAPTSYLSAANVYNPTFSAGTNAVNCPVVYTVTAIKNGCAFTDHVNVNVIDAATSLDSQSVACGGWSYGNTTNCSGAVYSWQLVSGPGVVPSGNSLAGGGANAYLVNTGGTNAVYRRITTLNGVSCNSGDITVVPCASGGGCPVVNIGVMSPQGCPKVFGSQDLQLYVSGVNAADYHFAWTPANIMDNPNAPVVTIASTAPVTVNVTLTNIYTNQVCTVPSLEINDPAWSLPVLNVLDTVFSCSGAPVIIGETATAGSSYTWSPALGLNSATLADPTATLTASTGYTVTKSDDVNGCKVTSDVMVQVTNIDFDAGPNHAVCNGATVVLGTVPGGSYTYSWMPVNAAWTNGTGPTDANPQVLFASSAQTFNVTITDPVSGCQKIDTITLSGTLAPGEYAGAAVGPLCPGQTAQLGASPATGATYSWSPATGLSCTTCANPIVTAGTANEVYSVTVSYPGCTTPVTDNVTVSVNALPAVILTDKNICPSTPANIGIGGAGNTATLANVSSYSWAPATGLSCTNCASPNANPQAVTTYNATITLANGCIVNEDVVVTPTVQASAKPDATICPGGSVVLGSPAVPNVTYDWTVLSGTTGSVTPANIAQPTATPAITSVYSLTATGTGPNAGCTITDDVTITVKTLPALTITGNTAVCENGATTLSATPVTPNTIYQWSPLAGVVSPNSPVTAVLPDSTMVYRVTQTDLNSGCSDYEEVTVTVWPNNVAAIGGSLTVCPGAGDTLPLNVTPASGNTISWSPVTYLNNPYVQNPAVFPLGSMNYVATVTNNTSNCTDTALVIVTVPASCSGSDYGDAPAAYDGANPASHGISGLIRIGSAIDGESGPVSAAMNMQAVGDDDNNPINDEEGVSFLPALHTGSQSLGLIVNNVLNNTADTAYVTAWIDFNRDGDFNDAGERSQIVPVPPDASAANQVMQFNGFNSGCVVQAGPSYLRIRLTSDTTGGWKNAPQPNGSRANGEVEDYELLLMGADYGDAPIAYPLVRATVNPDLNNNGQPDAAGSVWLGNSVDYEYSCNYVPSVMAETDDIDNATNDEDGLQMSAQVPIGVPVPWTITVNSQGPVTAAQWGMWIDWNADGTFDDFYGDSVNTNSPTSVTVNVTAPANATTGFIVRMAAKAPGTAFTAADFNSSISNGEWEDYIRTTPLPVRLMHFDAIATDCSAAVSWATANEKNCDHFDVEQSTDGKIWKVAQRIASAGTSDEVQAYDVIVPLIVGANNYLRLKMADEDGNHQYSMIRVLRCDGRSPILIWPNPSAMKVQVSGLPEGGTLRITDISGKEVMRKNNVSTTEMIDIEGLPSAVYQIITLDGNGQKIDIQKLIKQ